MNGPRRSPSRYALAIDLDRCTGCGACMVACAVENNVATPPASAGERKGITWIRVYRVDRDGAGPGNTVFVPLLCQHCEHHTPCVQVCPQSAVELDPRTGIVAQVPERCLGCRYCMAACPYHARYFNWWKPVWPGDNERRLNPMVSPRMRGVVEKCNLCHGRLQDALARAATDGRRSLRPGEFVPACCEVCPTGALAIGDLSDPDDPVTRLQDSPRAFRLLERLGTGPRMIYLSSRAWVRQLDHDFGLLQTREPHDV